MAPSAGGTARQQGEQQGRRLGGSDDPADSAGRQRVLQGRPEPGRCEERVVHQADAQGPQAELSRRRAGQHQDQRGVRIRIQARTLGRGTTREPGHPSVHGIEQERGRAQDHHQKAWSGSGDQPHHRFGGTKGHDAGPAEGDAVRGGGKTGFPPQNGAGGPDDHRGPRRQGQEPGNRIREDRRAEPGPGHKIGADGGAGIRHGTAGGCRSRPGLPWRRGSGGPRRFCRPASGHVC